MFWALLLALLLFSLWAILTNPFWLTWHVVKLPFSTYVEKGEIKLIKQYDIHVRMHVLARALAFAKCGYHIVANSLSRKKRVKSRNLQTIIRTILKERFNPHTPYLIAGDHFIVHFPRNLGVFYYPAFDASTALSKEDWENRQRVLLQTTAFNLAVCSRMRTTATTLVPVSRHSITPVNIFAYPSDSLYSIFFALSALTTKRILKTLYPYQASYPHLPLMAQKATHELIAQYRPLLAQLLTDYVKTVYNPQTKLVRKDIRLSGTKDITKRTSAFYDNVILWRTLILAHKLGVPLAQKINTRQLRRRIINHYWSNTHGYFREDDSMEARESVWYSSDWLVTLFTGFLKVNRIPDLQKYESVVAHIIERRLDEPFPLRYHGTDRGYRQYHLVRLFLPEYGGSAIWSFWGMEYCKLLLLLYAQTKKKRYLMRAKRHVKRYDTLMRRYHGFPEVYDTRGNLLQRLWYRSMIKTGWVVNYIQVQAMVREF